MAFTGDELEARFLFDDPVDLVVHPRYNIAPTQETAVVVMRDGRRRLESFRWGLVPHWADDPAIGNRMINARSETVHSSNAFRGALKQRRCLIPASGFFEWKKHEKGRGKTPYNFFLKGVKPFAFAGLWETWKPKGTDAAPLHTFTIITTQANSVVKSVHERMPVILPQEQEAAWLDPHNTDTAALRAMLKPYPPGDMDCHPVSTLVNSPKNDAPECIRPTAAPSQEDLFPQ